MIRQTKHLALSLVIENENEEMFDLILSKFQQSFQFDDLIEIIEILLAVPENEIWTAGMRVLIRSQTT